MTENLEKLCFHKRAIGNFDVDKSRCVLKCDGYDILCSNYFTLYNERLSKGFQEGGEEENE